MLPLDPPRLPFTLLPASGSTPMALHMRANSARNVGFDFMVSACWRAKLCRRDWKTESWVLRDERCVLRKEAPWVAYELEREVRFWNAERPTPRRADMAVEVSLPFSIISVSDRAQDTLAVQSLARYKRDFPHLYAANLHFKISATPPKHLGDFHRPTTIKMPPKKHQATVKTYAYPPHPSASAILCLPLSHSCPLFGWVCSHTIECQRQLDQSHSLYLVTQSLD